MKSLGKTIVLLMLIIIMALGGLLWFDYLGVMHVRTVFNPLFKALGKDPQTSVTATSSAPVVADLDQDRINKQLESIEIQREELARREEEVAVKEQLNEQIANELISREKSQEDREKTFNQTVKQYDDKNKNIEQIAVWLNSSRPSAAVAELEAMDDQTIIDVLRKCEEIAEREGKTSQSSYWLSLMKPQRAAEIQRKMLSKPESL